MAEFVEKGCEEMIPQLEQMRRIKLFDDNEIRKIIKNLKDHEYRIGRLTKSKEDFMAYFSYLMIVLNLVKQRRLKLGITVKQADIDYSIIKKIQQLYRRTRLKFQSDLSYWIDLMKLIKAENFQQHLPDIANRLLKVHQDKPRCWHISAQWHMKETKNIEKARKQLLRGLHFHPSAQILYVDLLELELQVASSSEEDAPIDLKRARLVYKEAHKNIQDVDFIIKLLDITSKFEGTESLQKMIMDDLIKDYSHEPKAWDKRARREFEGLSYNSQEETIDGKVPKKTLRNCLESAIEIYEIAVKTIPTKLMWGLYISFLLEINKDSSNLPNYKSKLLKTALTRGHNENNLEEKHYLLWIKIFKNNQNSEKFYQILDNATEAVPKSFEFWKQKLNFLFFKTDQEDLAFYEFNKAMEILGDEGLSLWKMKLLYMQKKHPENIEENFVEALKGNSKLSLEVKPDYIKWLLSSKGIQEARRIYKELSIQPPYSLELHYEMADAELKQPEISLQNARHPHELALLQFGKNNVDVWINYITFEMNYGDLLNVTNIYQRAVKSLSNVDSDTFITKFTLLKTNSEPMDH